jgi:hypothetical protein
LCTSMPIYFLLSIEGRSFLWGLRQPPKPYSKRGALLYCVVPDYRRSEVILYLSGSANQAVAD